MLKRVVKTKTLNTNDIQKHFDIKSETSCALCDDTADYRYNIDT